MASKVNALSMEILQLVAKENEITPGEIAERFSDHSPRDLKYAIRRLREKGMIRARADLFDMRRVYYRIASLDELDAGKLNELEKETIDNIYSGTMFFGRD